MNSISFYDEEQNKLHMIEDRCMNLNYSFFLLYAYLIKTKLI